MPAIHAVTLMPELRTHIEADDFGRLVIVQIGSNGITETIIATPHQASVLKDFLTSNIEAMHSRAALYGDQ